MEDIRIIIQQVNEVFDINSKFGLEIECIASAFKALKEDPSLTIEQVLEIGIDEWIK